MKRNVLFLTGWFLMLPAVGATPPPFDALYAFGDSLTDTGRRPAEPLLHYEGRWSNGPLWVEYMSTLLGLAYDPDKNLAHSGAQCDDTYQQVIDFTPTNDVSLSLFVVWAGGNDFLQEYDQHWFDDSGWDEQIRYSVGSLSNAVLNLHAKGARFILVPNTVDVTKIPPINVLPGFSRNYLRGKVQQFNAGLKAALDSIQAGTPSLTLHQFDFYTHANLLIANAAAFGFTKTDIDAVADVTLLDKSFDGPGADYVFWDSIHPTTKAHRMISDWFDSVASPIPAGMTLQRSDQQFSCTLDSLVPGRRYDFRTTDDLANWSVLHSIVAYSTDTVLALTNDSPAAFFSVKPLD